ncbi:MAG: hypothetical protein AAFN40_05700 [Cyanobacteria bacterium J06560_6]
MKNALLERRLKRCTVMASAVGILASIQRVWCLFGMQGLRC